MSCQFHLFYADDVLLFTNGSSRTLHNLMSLLKAYEQSSGQRMNLSKSPFYIGARAKHQVTTIATFTGFNHHQFPFMYLGLPVYDGRMKVIYYGTSSGQD